MSPTSGGPVGPTPDDRARCVDQAIPILRDALSHAFETAAASPWSDAVCPDAAYLHDNFLRSSAGILAAMLDGAISLAALVPAKRSVVSLFAVSRSTVETAAIGCWLLANGLSDSERARRAASMTLDGFTEMDIFRAGIQTSIRRLALGPDAQPPDDPQMTAEIEWWLEWAGRAGYATGRRSKRGPIRHTILDEHGEDRPSMGQLVEALLAAIDTDHVLGEGQAYYRIASAVVHGDWHARAILGFTGEEEARDLFRAPSLDAAELVILMAIQATAGVVEMALELLEHDEPIARGSLADLRAAAETA